MSDGWSVIIVGSTWTTGFGWDFGDDDGSVDVEAVAKYLGVSPLEVQVVLDATRRVG